MKTISALLFASIALAQNAVSQTPAPVKPHPAPVVKSAAPTAKPAAPTPTGCVKLPALSPKIPALPPGSPCFKPLYTITPIPTATLSYISPIEDPHLRDVLGISLPENINLSYVDTKIGDGALVVPRKWYTIKYAGYLTDGTEFDASDKHPEIGGTFSFPQGQHQVVIGMDTGLDGMRVGGKRRLFIPWILAYRDQPHLSIPAKSDLIFDIELVSQSDTDPTPKAPPAASTPAAAPSTAPAAAPATTPSTTAPPQPTAPKP
jgi:peptidylprolyl isomerase